MAFHAVAGTVNGCQPNPVQQHIAMAAPHVQYSTRHTGPTLVMSDHGDGTQINGSTRATIGYEADNSTSSNSKDASPQKGTVAVELTHVPIRVAEQRVSNLLQSLFVAVCIGITYAIRQIPTAVVWGYFAYMAIESLPGSQFWDRLLLLFTDPDNRRAELRQVGLMARDRV
jgi:hypothetical protein